MASIKIMHHNASLVDIAIKYTNENKKSPIAVDLNFVPLITLQKSLNKGFDVKKYEELNPFSKVLVDGIRYT